MQPTVTSIRNTPTHSTYGFKKKKGIRKFIIKILDELGVAAYHGEYLLHKDINTNKIIPLSEFEDTYDYYSTDGKDIHLIFGGDKVFLIAYMTRHKRGKIATLIEKECKFIKEKKLALKNVVLHASK